MSLIETLSAVLLFITLCRTLTLPPSEYTSIRQPGPILNGSFSDSELSVQCNGRQFGSDLVAESCLNALNTFELAGSSASFVIDRRRIGMYGRALPWKWVSGNDYLRSCPLRMYVLLQSLVLIIPRRIGDGRCVFDIVMKGREPSETTSGSELARAARRLILECIGARGGVGGVVSNIGKSAPKIGKNAEDEFRVMRVLSDIITLLFLNRSAGNSGNHPSLL